MTTVYDVNANELNKLVSEELKKNDKLKAPDWAKFVKTGANKYRPPEDKDWWYSRLASLLRNLYIKGPKGIQRLRNRYGSRRKRGYQPKKHMKGGGKILRVGLQMLEKEGLVKMMPKKGRVITDKGKSLLDKKASSIKKGLNKKETPKKEMPKEVKEAPKKEEKK